LAGTPRAFTAESTGRLRELVTPISLADPSKIVDLSQLKDAGALFTTRALWDTGASNCAITTDTANALGLRPSSKAFVNHAGGQSLQNVYHVHIFLPNGVALRLVRVTECANNTTWGLIIGMDVITRGDFAITNIGGKTTFSFRFPSTETIDFVKAHPIAPPPQPIAKAGRNDKCPCGSGKKYKHCHGR